MTIIIPDEALAQSRLSPAELRIELAAYLYEKRLLSIGKARTGLLLVSFQKELAKRGIYLHLKIQDLEIELKNLELS